MSAEVLPGVEPGTRVVVRYLIEDGDRATDALGELTARDGTHLVVQTGRHGTVRIALTAVVTAKVVPPAPPPRRPRQLR